VNSLDEQLNMERDLQREAGRSADYREGGRGVHRQTQNLLSQDVEHDAAANRRGFGGKGVARRPHGPLPRHVAGSSRSRRIDVVDNGAEAMSTEVAREGRSGLHDIRISNPRREQVAEFRSQSRIVRTARPADPA